MYLSYLCFFASVRLSAGEGEDEYERNILDSPGGGSAPQVFKLTNDETDAESSHSICCGLPLPRVAFTF